jgi:DNA repair exonuclease SbcCD ATPase subunit
MLFRILAVSCLTIVSITTVGATSQIPYNLPETQAVYQDLSRLKSECDRTITMARQLRTAVASVRKGVDQSIDVTSAIRAMDKRLVKLIDQLKPYHSIPKVRTATRTLSKNLSRIQSRLHELRLKTDRCETKVLRPTRDRLRSLESSLVAAERKLRELSLAASGWMVNLSQAARQAQPYVYARQALEASSRAARPITRTALNAVVTVRSQADSVGYKFNALTNQFGKFRTVGNSLEDMSEKMAGGEKLAGNLDKALGKRLTIKIPFSKKSLSFTVRDILEKPGKVMNVVLKPLEKLADAVLQPVLKKLKLEIQPPKGLTELGNSLVSVESAGRNLANAISGLERQLQSELDRQLNQLRSRMNQPLDVVRQARQAPQPAPIVRPDVRPVEQGVKWGEPRKLPMFLTFG